MDSAEGTMCGEDVDTDNNGMFLPACHVEIFSALPCNTPEETGSGKSCKSSSSTFISGDRIL